MKRLIFILIFLASSLITMTSAADEQREERFMPERLWHFTELPAWYFLWTTIHEGSHALTATALGYENCYIHPYPHEHNGIFSYGDSFCAGGPKTRRGDALIYIMPSIIDIAVFTTSDFLLTRRAIDPDSLAGGLLFLGGMLAPWLDFTLNANNFDANYADNAIFAKLVGIPRWSVIAIQDVIAAAGLWRLISTFREVFFKETPTLSNTVSILPFTTYGPGLQAIGQF